MILSSTLILTLFFAQDAPFNTNNLIESYHNQLKTNYMQRARTLRVDNLIYILTKCLVLDNRRDAAQVSLGIKPAYLNEYERQRQAIAYAINLYTGIAMIKKVDDSVNI